MTYVAHAQRDETGWWVATVDELPGVVTQARRFAAVHDNLVEAIAALQDIEIEDVKPVRVVPVFADGPIQLIEAYHATVATARTVANLTSVLSRQIAAKLVRDEHLPLRDAGDILGLSHQRVAQLLAPGREAPHPDKE